MFLGYENIIEGRRPKAEQKVDVDRFVDRLVVAGFPVANIKMMHTGVWIDVKETTLTVQCKGSVTSLCDKETVLASCDKNSRLFADPYVVYSFYPDAIKPLGARLAVDMAEDAEEPASRSSSPSL